MKQVELSCTSWPIAGFIKTSSIGLKDDMDWKKVNYNENNTKNDFHNGFINVKVEASSKAEAPIHVLL